MKKNWLPTLFQYEFIKRNPSYLHSLFLGLVNPLVQAPALLFYALILPVLFGLLTLLRIFIVYPVLGVMGMLDSNDLKGAMNGVNQMRKSIEKLEEK